MTNPKPTITVNVDVTNPGQFFACCGLLELADRLWPGVEGWFEDALFHLEADRKLEELLSAIKLADLIQLEPGNDTASSIRIGAPFDRDLDWWTDELAGGSSMKVWAGSMRNVRIARAMQHAIADVEDPYRLFDFGAVVYDPDSQSKKVEPFYFDSRRGWNAQSRDIGFAPDSFSMTTAAFPAVEFLCLVGLQRFRAAPTNMRRVFSYYPWSHPLPVNIAPLAASGVIAAADGTAYSFEVGFRTDQKKHKAFLPATPITTST